MIVSDEIIGRIDGGRCIVCNGYIVDAWFCDGCGVSTDFGVRPEEKRGSTATKVSKMITRRQDIETEADHVRTIAGIRGQMIGGQHVEVAPKTPHVKRRPTLTRISPGGYVRVGTLSLVEGDDSATWDEGTEHDRIEHLIALEMSRERSADYGEGNRVLALYRNQHTQGFSRDELTRWSEALAKIDPMWPGFEGVNRAAFQEAMSKRRRARNRKLARMRARRKPDLGV